MQRRFPFTQAESFHNRAISRHANLQLFCGPGPALINVLWGEEIKHPTADTKIDSPDRLKSPSFNENKLSLHYQVDFARSVTRCIKTVRTPQRLVSSGMISFFWQGGSLALPPAHSQTVCCMSVSMQARQQSAALLLLKSQRWELLWYEGAPCSHSSSVIHLHRTLQLMTFWGGVRLTAPTFLTFQVLARDDCFPSNLHTGQPQGACGASGHVHTKLQLNLNLTRESTKPENQSCAVGLGQQVAWHPDFISIQLSDTWNTTT